MEKACAQHVNVLMKNALKNITEEQHEEGKEESENSFQNGLCFNGLCLAVSGLGI